MSFLVALAAQIIEWLLSKLGALGLVEIKKIAQDNEINQQAKQDENNLNGAKTDDQKDQALDDIIHHTFD